MSYQRFKLPDSDSRVATVATERFRGVVESVATVATVAVPEVPDADVDERAAIVEHEAGAPREWAEGFARLDVARPPSGFAHARWRQLINDGGLFLDRWARQAVALGWSAADVFGLHPGAPSARYDGMGLVALINGGEVIAIEPEHATIRMRSGTCLTYYLRRPHPETVAAWDLVGTNDKRGE